MSFLKQTDIAFLSREITKHYAIMALSNYTLNSDVYIGMLRTNSVMKSQIGNSMFQLHTNISKKHGIF